MAKQLSYQRTYYALLIGIIHCLCLCLSTRKPLNVDQTKYARKISIIYPKARFKRSLETSKHANTINHDMHIKFNHDSEEFAIYLRRNEHLVTSGTLVEWHFSNGTKRVSKLNDIASSNVSNQEKRHSSSPENHNNNECLFIGEVISANAAANGEHSVSTDSKSIAAIDVCDGGYRGYLQIGKDGYIIRPLRDHKLDYNAGVSNNGKAYNSGKNRKYNIARYRNISVI